MSTDHYGLAVSEHNLVDEPAVGAARGDGQHPRRDVADVPAVQHAGVPGPGGGEHPSPHGVEGPDGGGVLEVRRRGLAPDGEGDDVHAVGDGVVEAGEDGRPAQPSAEQTRYMATLDAAEPPLAVPAARP